MTKHNQNHTKAKAININDANNQSFSSTTKNFSIGKKTSIAITLTFGLFLVYGAGFALPQAIHNAAHDTRHSVAFPCH